MGCGGSTAQQADEPMAGVMPNAGGGGIASVKQAPAAIAAPVVPKPKKATVVYDPHSAAFPPSAASLQRKFPGRPPVLVLTWQPEWKRAPDVLAAKAASATAQPPPAEEAKSADDPPADEPTPTPAPAAPAPSVFSSSTHEDNVVAGPFADPHIIAALVSIGAHPNRLIRLFPVLDEPEEEAATATGSTSPPVKKNPYLKGILVGSKVKSNSLAKVALQDSEPKFAASVQSGKYAIRLFYGGLFQTFQVDDFIPVSQSTESHPIQQPLFTQSKDGSEFWMMLVEKALAKIRGSYEDLFHTNPIDLFRFLTGGSGEIINLAAELSTEKINDLWTGLSIAWKRADLLSCITRVLDQQQLHAALASKRTPKKDPESNMDNYLADHQELGVDAQYTILDIQHLPPEMGGARLVLLRNPQGSQKWLGRWGDGTEEWKELEAKQPDGQLYATKLRLSRKKQSAMLTGARQASGGAESSTAATDGLFWIQFEDFCSHFSAIFSCSVLADQFDQCLTQLGEWKGRSAAGKPYDLLVAGIPSNHNSTQYNNWLYNPSYRIRNTAQKKSGPIVVTLSKGTQMCNALNAAVVDSSSKKPNPIFIGFKLIANQLNHTLNCNPPVSSPLFGSVQVSPLYDDVLTSKFTSGDSISLTIPSLEPYKDFYLIPYTSEVGVEGDFVFNLWTNSSSILFDACVPQENNPLEFPCIWSRRDGSAAGNLWSEVYLNNPTWMIKNTGEEPAKLLVNLMKLQKKFDEVNCNVRILVNNAPMSLNATAVGTVSAPAKPLGGGAGGGTGAGAKRGSVIEEKTPSTDSASAPAAAQPEKKKSSKTLTPVSGSLSPFYEAIDGTRWGQESFYGSGKNYPVVLSAIQPGKEYYLVASTFTAGTDCEALLQVFGSSSKQMESIKVERVGREYTRILPGRWSGVNAAGPARRKKTYLNNPQFCLRHHAAGPISVVISLLLPSSGSALGMGHTDLAVNLTVATFPEGTSDPNPFSDAQVDAAKRGLKDVTRKAEKETEQRKKLEQQDKAKAQAALLGQNVPQTQQQQQGAGVASLRIKAKGTEKGGSKKKKDNMFDADFGSSGSSGSHGTPAWSTGDFLPTTDTQGGDVISDLLDEVPRVNPLSTDFELVTQTMFNGELYKANARLVHLFLPEVAPNRSYFIIPSTSVPGQESEFTIQAFGASSTAELLFEPCFLNSVADGVDMTGLASRRASAAFGASIASHKAAKVTKDGKEKPKHKKPDRHR